MAEVFTSAGLAPTSTPAPDSSPRREAIRAVRAIIRDPKATDADVEDALEALVELSRTQE